MEGDFFENYFIFFLFFVNDNLQLPSPHFCGDFYIATPRNLTRGVAIK